MTSKPEEFDPFDPKNELQLDNLKYKTMAKNKAISKGDTFNYDMIEYDLMEKPDYKGLALDSSSVKIFEE